MTKSEGQLTFDELGTPLRATTFVVFDLETTGVSDEDTVTEIGAVKVRGGEFVGEFATLVDPGRGIPPEVISLTGITDAMVYTAPRLDTVLPAFLEFARGAVLVAHNAGFDTNFMRKACHRHGYRWPRPTVVCTVQLARRVLTREEAPSCRLSFLAELLGARTRPIHRALADARATVDVFHSLLERVGSIGVQSLEELLDFIPEVTPEQRRKRTMAAALPNEPGVYLFRGPGEEVLYVGTATDLKRRVRQYFTASETRRRLREMVALATRVDHVPCWRRRYASCGCWPRTSRRTTGARRTRGSRGGSRSPTRRSPGCRWSGWRVTARSARSGPARWPRTRWSRCRTPPASGRARSASRRSARTRGRARWPS
jgi:DNA polymerase III subunit epsilon